MAMAPRMMRLQGGADLLRQKVVMGFIAPGESPFWNLSGGLAATPSGVALPVEGAILE
jgi:hypothetical protein